MKVFAPINPSSNIFRATHDGVSLTVAMKGGTYTYFDVPVEKLKGLITAESAGKYLNSEIKPGYLCGAAPSELASAIGTAELADTSEFLNVEATATGRTSSGSPNIQSNTPKSDEADRVMKAFSEPHLKVLQTLLHPHFNNWPQIVDIKLLDPKVEVKYAKPGDAAFDLMAASASEGLQFPLVIQPGQHMLIGTGIAMKLSLGLAGLAMPRSGLANKFRISLVNAPGLIDSGYTGEIKVLVENRGHQPFVINQYDRIAQYMIVPAITPIFRVVDDLEQTERGEGGFGSSGIGKSVV